MTCIVGIRHNGEVYIGGDSCGSDGHSYTDVQGQKVFNVGPHLIGCTGTFRLIDLLRYKLSVKLPREGEDLEEYIRGDLLGAVKSTLKAGDYLKAEHGVSSFRGPFLMGCRGGLWEFQGDLSVIATPPWGHAVGSGHEAARGALYALRNTRDPAKRVFGALRAAEGVVTTVRRPFHLLKLDLDGKVTRLAEVSS